jgi:hypothetical protein
MPSKNSRLARQQQALVLAKRQCAEAFEREGQWQFRNDWIPLGEIESRPPESDEDDILNLWTTKKQKDAQFAWEKMQWEHESVWSSPALQRPRKRLDKARAAVEAEQEQIERKTARKRAKEEQLKKLAAEEAQKKAERAAVRKRKQQERTAKAAEEVLGNPASSEPRQRSRLKTGAKRGRRPFDFAPVKPQLSALYEKRGPPSRHHRNLKWQNPKWQYLANVIHWVLEYFGEAVGETAVKIFVNQFDADWKEAHPDWNKANPEG